MKKVKIAAIAAMDLGRVIGVNNTIPWRYPQDMKHFAELTTGHTVLMGRRTYDSLPAKFRPLPNRLNIVSGRTCRAEDYPKEVMICNDIASFLEKVKLGEVDLMGDYLWIIGGAQVYQLTVPYWEEVFLTIVPQNNQGDAFFPQFEENFEIKSEETTEEGLIFRRYIKINK